MKNFFSWLINRISASRRPSVAVSSLFPPRRGVIASLVLVFSAALTLAASTPVRLSVLEGNAAVRHSGIDVWEPLEPNFPLSEGDRLVVQPGSRLELEIGMRAAVRLDSGADFSIQSVSPLKFQLFHGSAIVRTGAQDVRIGMAAGELLLRSRGHYRVNVNETNDEVIVFQGTALLPEGEELRSGWRAVLSNGRLGSQQYQIAAADLFQLWSERRDSAYAFGKVGEYLPDGVPGGGADLDSYGNWDYLSSYGSVWYPIVSVGWSPYRLGHWYCSPYYGWTWISAEPWGWLPYHYGRWTYAGNRWCWIPGSASYFSTWSPALVYFLRNNLFVGWFPMGPGDALNAGSGRTFAYGNFGRGLRGGNWGTPGGLVFQPVDRFSRGEPPAQSVMSATWNLADARIASTIDDVRPNRGAWIGGERLRNAATSSSDFRNPSTGISHQGIPFVTGGAGVCIPPHLDPRAVIPQEGGSRVVIPRREPPSSANRPLWTVPPTPGAGGSAPINSRSIWIPHSNAGARQTQSSAPQGSPTANRDRRR